MDTDLYKIEHLTNVLLYVGSLRNHYLNLISYSRHVTAVSYIAY